MAAPADIFEIAKKWETVTNAERDILRSIVRGLVNYSFKLACYENDGVVDIYVQNEKKKLVTDWFELQPSGAIGVIFDEYPNPDSPSLTDLDNKCAAYNESIGMEFEDEDSDSEEGEEGEEGEESGEEQPDQKEKEDSA